MGTSLTKILKLNNTTKRIDYSSLHAIVVILHIEHFQIMSQQAIANYNSQYCISDLLPEEFLTKYMFRQPNWGYNGLGYITYKRTYSRKISNDQTEEWWQTVARCINGAQRIGAKYTIEEAQRLYDLVFNLKCNFAGRMLWQLGTSTVDRFGLASLVNCFAYETEIITDNGIKKIGDLSGKTANLMSRNGKYVQSEIKNFGQQTIWELKLSKGRSKKTIRTTENHRWFRKPYRNGSERNSAKKIEVLTRKLVTGDLLISTYGQSIKGNINPSPYGIVAGIVFGDESVCSNVGRVRLCGEKDAQLLKYFLNPSISNYDGDIIVGNLPKYFKDKPSLDMDKAYLYGWLAGYFAVDGSVKKKGQIRLSSASESNLNFVRDVLSKLGIGYSPITYQNRIGIGQTEPSKLYSININGCDLKEDFFLIESHKQRFVSRVYKDQRNWKVESIKQTTEVEEVYCAVVPDTHEFVLESNILTGNCWFSSMRELEDFCFLFEHLMLGGGVGFSVKREDIHELPRIRKGVVIQHQNAKDADFIVPDSRQGWVELLRKTLQSYFENGKSFTYSTILIRGAGEPIKGFGGTSSGPQILIDGLDKICNILNIRCGKKLRSIDVLDINNIIGSIVVAGNVRRCLPYDAMVHCERGLVRIKDVTCADRVLTSYGYKQVKNNFKQGVQETIKIKTQDGYFECTSNHKMAKLISPYEYEWVAAQDLKIGDRLTTTRIGISGGKTSLPPKFPLEFIPSEITDFEVGRTLETYDIEVEDVHEFYCNGYLTHNSAEIAIGDPDDYLYIKAKNWSEGVIPNWRCMSNNAIFSDTYQQISDDVWNNGYILDKKTGVSKGEAYGFVNLPLSKKYGRLGEERHDNCEGVNPCQPKWAKVLTKDGISTFENIKIGDEIWSKEGWTKVTNKWSTGIKKVFEYRTTSSVFYGTENHIVISNGVEVAAENAESIDSLVGEYNTNDIQLLPSIIMDGLVIGNGSIHKSSNKLIILHIGENDSDYFDSEINSLIETPRFEVSSTAYEINTSIEYSELDKTYNREIPDRFYYGSKSIVASFLRGLYSANGSVVRNRVILKTASSKIRDQVQTMLSSLGIRSYYTTNKPSNVQFSNGSYLCKESYDVNISTDIAKFKNIIGFIQQYENEKLEIVSNKISTAGRQTFDIKEVSFISEEEVFDITVDNTSHTYWTQGCDVHNCAEVTLADGEACNLSELYLNNIESQSELIECAKLLYKVQKAVWTLPTLYEKTGHLAKKNMRIGMGVTGICQSYNKLDWLDECYNQLRAYDKEWSAANNWPESIKLTTVKPSGSLSLLGGSTPGGHPSLFKYYIRRIRMNSADPLVKICRDAGYKTEYVIHFDGSEDYSTIIVEFPCESGETAILSKDMAAIQQLELVKKLQTIWADNSVSVTIYYLIEELPEIQQWMKDNYENSCKTMSFSLRNDHGFKQAPYEEIDEKEYRKLCKKIKPILNFGNMSDSVLDGLECSGGSCPIR